MRQPAQPGSAESVPTGPSGLILPDVLVDADWVQANLDDPGVVPVEVAGDTGAYDKGHIRGAVRLDWQQDLQDPRTRGFIDRADFEALLSRIAQLPLTSGEPIYAVDSSVWARCDAETSSERGF